RGRRPRARRSRRCGSARSSHLLQLRRRERAPREGVAAEPERQVEEREVRVRLLAPREEVVHEAAFGRLEARQLPVRGARGAVSEDEVRDARRQRRENGARAGAVDLHARQGQPPDVVGRESPRAEQRRGPRAVQVKPAASSSSRENGAVSFAPCGASGPPYVSYEPWKRRRAYGVEGRGGGLASGRAALMSGERKARPTTVTSDRPGKGAA